MLGGARWRLELTAFWPLFLPPQAFKADDFLNWHALSDVSPSVVLESQAQ